MAELFFLVITGLLNISFIYIIAAGKSNKLQNKLFLTAIFFNVLWVLGVYLLLFSDNQTIIPLSRFFFIAPMFTAYFLILFAHLFPDNRKTRGWRLSLYLVIPLLAVAWPIAVNPAIMFDSVDTSGKINTFEFNKQTLLIYGGFFVTYFSYSYILLLTNSFKYKGVTKFQLRFMFYSALLSSGPALFTNILLPYLGITHYLWLGPVFTIAYLAIVTYSIARYRMLDARIIVTRTLAYLVSLGVVTALFYAFIFVFFSGIFQEIDLFNFENTLLFMVALIAGAFIGPIKAYFDKITNKLFYRYAYDSQIQLNKLSNVVVNEYEVDKLVSRSIEVIKETVRPTKTLFILVEKKQDYYDSFGDGFDDNPEAVLELIKDFDEPVFHSGKFDAESMQVESSKNEKLNAIDIVLTVRLSVNEQTVGYIILGPKLSGNQYSTQDERFLEIAANELSIAIQNSLRYDEIKRFNETLRLEVDRATAELRESNRKLKELDEAKDEFVTMASHQLRTPLTSVKGYISMVMEGDAGKITKRQEELLANAFTSSQRMVYLIADLLNVSRLRTGKFMIDAREVNLKDIIESEIDQLKETAKSRGLTLKFNAPKSFPNTMLDEEKIRQVIMNFIDNAIYYTPSKGKIEVNLESTDKEIKMTVKDNGIGVPKQDRPNLFTKFYRAGNARKARPDGTGLGLFMAKKVVVAQGGAIVFDSKEGQGSTFGFTFPLSRVGIKDKKSSKKSKKSDAAEKK